MKVREVISEVRAFNTGKYEDKALMRWLGRLEARIYTEVIGVHEGYEEKEPTDCTDPDAELFCPDEYGDMYRHYLDSMIYASNGEGERAQNSAVLFNSIWSDYANWYNREYLPLRGEKIKF